MIYIITIDTDQPFADQFVANGAQAIAAQLAEGGTHYTVTAADQFDNLLCTYPAKTE